MTISIATVQRMVCAEFNVTLGELVAHRRSRSVDRVRQVAFYLCRELTSQSLPVIGRKFLREHGTVHHGAAVVQRLIARDPAFAERVNRIRQAVIEIDGPPSFPTTLSVVPRRVSFHMSSHEQPVKSAVSRETVAA